MDIVLKWIDVIWLPLAWFVVNKEQRWMAVGTIAACMLMMRLEAELIESIGYSTGMLPILSSHVLNRGLFIYSLFYAFYLVLSWYSPNTQGWMFVAVSLSIFFMSTFTSIFLMVL